MAAHQAPPSLGFSSQEHWSGLPFPSPVHESEKWKWSRLVVSDSSPPHGLQPTRLLCPWDFPGKSTRVGCHCLLWIKGTNTQLGWFWLQLVLFFLVCFPLNVGMAYPLIQVSAETLLPQKDLYYPLSSKESFHHSCLLTLLICLRSPFYHLIFF